MSETLRDYDVVIIGSGAGGGTVAKELAPLCREGLKVALLEWGGRFEGKDNTRRELEMAGKYYFDYGGVQNADQDMTFAFARAVGGSTTVYTGTSLTAPQRVFDKWGVPGIRLDELKPRYDKYIRENNVHLNPPGEINGNNRLFIEACRKLGWSAAQFPVNTKGCVGLSTCNLGCAVGAKQGTAVVQIPMATAQGVELIPFCRADRIAGSDVIAEVVEPAHGLAPSPWPAGRYRIRARKIVVCAGVVNSPALLMRSFGRGFSKAVGRYFTCHPALILVADHEGEVGITSGHPKSYYCDEFLESRGFLLESCFYFPFTLAKNLAGFGAEVDELIARYRHLQMVLVLAVDEPEEKNRIAVDGSGKPVIRYRMSEKTIGALVEAIRASTRLFFAAGARRVHAPAAGRFFIKASEVASIDSLVTRARFKPGQISITAAHLMGGCRMGTDPRTSVTDAWGRVHGRPGVYVADASLFPAASEVNPYLTIMALSDRVAEAVRADLGFRSAENADRAPRAAAGAP